MELGGREKIYSGQFASGEKVSPTRKVRFRKILYLLLNIHECFVFVLIYFGCCLTFASKLKTLEQIIVKAVHSTRSIGLLFQSKTSAMLLA